MTEDEFWRDFGHIRGEVDRAIESFYTYLTIHATARENHEISGALNRNPKFWNIQLYSLQTTFFITMGRIFDAGNDAHSVHKLVSSAISHPEFFSKESLARRKADGANIRPDWLDDYLSDVFVPEIDHLRTIKKLLNSLKRKFDATCREIRTSIFAHGLTNDQQAVSVLFAKAEIVEIEGILYVLHDLMLTLWHLYQNGRSLDFGRTTREYKDLIQNSTRDALAEILLPPKLSK